MPVQNAGTLWMVKYWSPSHKDCGKGFAKYSLVKMTVYLSFLLRLWRVEQSDEDGWRASLEDPHTGETRGFASLELLGDFLREQTQTAGKGKGKDDRKSGGSKRQDRGTR